MAEKLKFGLMCRNTTLPWWQAEAVARLIAGGHRLVLVVRDARSSEKPGWLKRQFARPLRTMFFSLLENRLFAPDSRKPATIGELIRDVDTIDCCVETIGFSEYFSKEDLAGIGRYETDFILRFGFGIIRGEILSVPKFGIWSFHHGDEMKYRGGPAGFWEIFHDEPVTGAILQRLTDRLDGGIILRKGYFQTVRHSWKGNLDQLYRTTIPWPAEVADRLSDGNLESKGDTRVESCTKAPVFRVPGNLKMVRFVLGLVRSRLLFHLRRLFRAEMWKIGIISSTPAEMVMNGRLPPPERITWLENPSSYEYLADPSGFHVDDRLAIIAERFSYRTMKGKLAMQLITEAGGSGTGDWRDVVLPGLEGSHLSYPFVFSWQGETWLVPESSEAGKVVLFRFCREKGNFVSGRVLLNDVAAVDPTLVHAFGTWWLFFTPKEYSNSHLYVYYAGSLQDEFRPHMMNPVKMDIRCSRPAGAPFFIDGKLYRPAQDCSVSYGRRVVINEVTALTTDDFAEHVTCTLGPVTGKGPSAGFHTLSGAGKVTLADGKFYRFSFANLFSRAGEMFKKRNPCSGR